LESLTRITYLLQTYQSIIIYIIKFHQLLRYIREQKKRLKNIFDVILPHKNHEFNVLVPSLFATGLGSSFDVILPHKNHEFNVLVPSLFAMGLGTRTESQTTQLFFWRDF